MDGDDPVYNMCGEFSVVEPSLKLVCSETSCGIPDVTYTATREYVPAKIIGYKRVPVEPDDSNDSNDYENPYDNNVVEFHAVTRSGRAGVYHGDTDESSPYAGPLGKDMYLYRAVLLGDGKSPCAGDPYTVLAVADLAKNGSYRQKPKDYELAFDWRVTFE